MASDLSSTNGRDEAIRKLVDAATELFAARGPDGVSLRQVAARAGVNYGLIHQYVGTKDDLLRLVFQSVSEHAAERFATADDLDAALDDLIGVGRQPTRYVKLLAWALLQGRDAHDLLGRSPALTTLVHRVDSTGADPFAARLRVAAVVSMNLGWQLFGSFVSEGVGLHEYPDTTVDDQRRALIKRLLSGEASATD
jgi:TetR/AcrR family transcriptional regulator, repressor for neighboring sulfatase